MIKKYLAEGIGTFFLMLAVSMASGELAPLAVGVLYVGLMYAGGHVSAAHYNPAVSLAALLRSKLPQADLPMYLVAQLVGATLATLLAGYLLSVLGRSVVHNVTDDPIAFILTEFLGTFGLCYVVLQVATTRGTAGNAYYGVAIGLTMVGLAMIFGGITGAVFNPAVALGTCIQSGAWGEMVYFLVGQLLGAAAAATVVTAMEEEPS
jgi:aquaporin Z